MTNGVNLEEEAAFWEHCARYNTIVQHKPDGKGKENRFARYNDEALIDQQSALGDIRLELRDTPVGSISTSDSGYQLDTFTRTLRVVAKFELNDFDDKLAKQQQCKEALLEIVRYIEQQQEEGNTCGTILHMLDLKQIAYQVVETAAADATFTGIQMRIAFRQKLSNAKVNYPPFAFAG